VQILDHDAVEANLPSCGWSAVVIRREFSPHGPDAVPAVDDMFIERRSLARLCGGRQSQSAAGRVTEAGVGDVRTSFDRTVR
jgi:hypothetical protein